MVVVIVLQSLLFLWVVSLGEVVVVGEKLKMD
jgi:hypothetical protein